MNPQDPLANLHPLRQPEVIGWWPPAPGWWLLGAILLAAAIAAAVFGIWRYRKNRYRRLGIKAQKHLYSEFERNGDSKAFAIATNALLKSVALATFPRAEVARRHGRDWVRFLNNTLGKDDAFEESFAESLYRPDEPSLDAARLQRGAMSWIKSHRAAP